jgi:hypothetical protein
VVSFIALTEATVTTFRNIPELVALLADGNPDNISGYIDLNPDKNSTSKAVYQMPPGTVLVIWEDTTFDPAAMGPWLHRFTYFVRARRGASALEVMHTLVDGVPNPGDGLRWRFCPLVPGVLPANVTRIGRVQDEEGIDYHVIETEIQETGDA